MSQGGGNEMDGACCKHVRHECKMREECRVPQGSVHDEGTREKVLRTTVVGGELMRKA